MCAWNVFFFAACRFWLAYFFCITQTHLIHNKIHISDFERASEEGGREWDEKRKRNAPEARIPFYIQIIFTFSQIRFTLFSTRKRARRKMHNTRRFYSRNEAIEAIDNYHTQWNEHIFGSHSEINCIFRIDDIWNQSKCVSAYLWVCVYMAAFFSRSCFSALLVSVYHSGMHFHQEAQKYCGNRKEWYEKWTSEDSKR